MKRKLLNVALLACIGVGALAGCNSSTITITNKEALKEEWHVGESYRTLEIATDPETNISSAITTGDIVISSSNTNVVTTAGLNIYAVGDGDVTITASWGGVSDSVDLSILEQIFYEMPYTVGEQYYLGFLTSSDEYKYIDGTTPKDYDYEGNLTMSLDEAIEVTLSDAGDGGYYLSFELNNVTYYICIVTVGKYIVLQYLTEPTAVYWNREIGAFGTEDGEYFLCYNSAYDCLYASLVSSYGPSSANPSPIATLYNPDEAIESTPWTCPEEEVDYITAEPTSGGTYYLALYNDYSESTYGRYYFTGSISNNYGATDQDVSKAAEVTVTAVSGGYTLSVTIDSNTKYIALVKKVKDETEGTYYYNFDLVDATVTTDGEGTNPTYTTFTWDSTYNTMVVNGVDIDTNNESGTTYFMGTYSSYTTFGMSKYSYLNGEHQYPGRLYPVSTGTEE
ncbi:MAG: hypothetical protein LUB56_01320 [Coprobacillus sp.]|nr:hypothetical protein [Coprobacillus sp.]